MDSRPRFLDYADLKGRSFFPGLIKYMASGPVVAMVWQGLTAVKTGRVMLGTTNPVDSAPGPLKLVKFFPWLTFEYAGSIRGDYCIAVGRNICHGSDSVESAEKEIAL